MSDSQSWKKFVTHDRYGISLPERMRPKRTENATPISESARDQEPNKKNPAPLDAVNGEPKA